MEIASRALSPAFNDPFTAMACIDRLGEALLLGDRALPPPALCDDQGELRLLENLSFASAVGSAFSMIRQYGRGHAVVLVRLLDTLAEIGAQTERADRRTVLLRHADMVLKAADESLPEEYDRSEVARHHQAVLKALGA